MVAVVGRVEIGAPDVDLAGGQAARDVNGHGLRGRGVHRLDDGAVVTVVRRLQCHVAAVGRSAAQVAAGRVLVLPADLRELGRVCEDPGRLGDAVVARPGLVGDGQPVEGEVGVGIERGDERPVVVGRHTAVDVVPVDGPCDRRRAGLGVLRPVLARPQRFAEVLRGAGARAALEVGVVADGPAVAVAAGVVDAHDVHRVLERRVAGHRVGHRPVVVGRDQLGGTVALGDQGGLEVLVPSLVEAALVPAAQVVDVELVLGGAAHPVRQVADRVGGEEGVAAATDPAGRAPGEPVELDVGIAGLGLLREPPLVALVAVDHALGVLVAGLGAVSGVGVAACLDLEGLERGAVAGLEQVVEDLAALRLRIVDQQPGVAAAARDRAHTVEGPARAGAVDGDRGRGGRLCRRRRPAHQRSGGEGEGGQE